MLEEKRTKHPSYGTVGFSRVMRSGETALFGTDIKHSNTIRLVIREAELIRHLNRDDYFGNKEIIEVEMSYYQFADAITSLNQGTGVPCTIRWREGVGQIEECPFESKKEIFNREFSEHLGVTNEKANSLIENTLELLEKKSLTKADREELIRRLTNLKAEINGNSEFVLKQFTRTTEQITTDSKAEIEAFVQNKINIIAQNALVEKADSLIADMQVRQIEDKRDNI